MHLGYVHKFRGLAILLIVAVHCVTFFDWSARPAMEKALLDGLGNSTVLFVFISGFLFQHLSSRFHYGRYLRSKLRNVIVPYLLMALPAIFRVVALQPDDPFYPPGFFDASVAWQVAWLYATGRMLTPYWFIPMIAIVFVLAPAFVAVDRRPWLYWSILPLTALAMMVHRPLYNIGPLHALIYFLPVYLCGMAASHHRDRLFDLLDRYAWAVWAALAGLTLAQAIVVPTTGIVQSPSIFLLAENDPDLLLPQKLLLAPLLLDLLRRFGRGQATLLDRLADISFGLYFIHPYVLLVIEKLKHDAGADIPGTLWGYGALTAAVALVSATIAASVRGVAGQRSRVLIGS